MEYGKNFLADEFKPLTFYYVANALWDLHKIGFCILNSERKPKKWCSFLFGSPIN